MCGKMRFSQHRSDNGPRQNCPIRTTPLIWWAFVILGTIKHTSQYRLASVDPDFNVSIASLTKTSALPFSFSSPSITLSTLISYSYNWNLGHAVLDQVQVPLVGHFRSKLWETISPSSHLLPDVSTRHLHAKDYLTCPNGFLQFQDNKCQISSWYSSVWIQFCLDYLLLRSEIIRPFVWQRIISLTYPRPRHRHR